MNQFEKEYEPAADLWYGNYVEPKAPKWLLNAVYGAAPLVISKAYWPEFWLERIWLDDDRVAPFEVSVNDLLMIPVENIASILIFIKYPLASSLINLGFEIYSFTCDQKDYDPSGVLGSAWLLGIVAAVVPT